MNYTGSERQRLAVGTAQFGSAYGIANAKGKVKLFEAEKILQLARNANVRTLDTAMNYGDAEIVLGRLGVRDFKIISKLPGLPQIDIDPVEWVNEQVDRSLFRLHADGYYALLLHKPEDLFSRHGYKLFDALVRLKKNCTVQKLGISVYTPEQCKLILAQFDFDIVQIPLNVFDIRFEECGLINDLTARGIEVHARSIFLQGLLLMPLKDIPNTFLKYRKLLVEWDMWVRDHSASHDSAMSACLSHAFSFENLGKLVVGVDDSSQFQEILNAGNSAARRAPVRFRSNDLDLIMPSRWRLLPNA